MKTGVSIIHPAVDALLVGGASILFFALFKLNVLDQTQAHWPVLAAQLMWVVNWPHFAATNYRLYGTKNAIQQYPLTALLVPIVVTGAIVASFASPEFVAPFYVKFYLFWSSYHFSGQTVGVTLLYSRRMGFHFKKWERLALSTFVFGTFAVQMALAETATQGNTYYGIHYPGLGIPMAFVELLRAGMWLGGALFAGSVIYRSFKKEGKLHPFIFLIPITQYVWFVAGALVPGFQSFVPFFHSVQYLLVAWWLQIQTAKQAGSTSKPVWITARWYAVNVVGGIVMFWVLPRVAAMTGVDLLFADGIVGASLQVHHFFVDGVIWKLRNKSVSSALVGQPRELAAA